MSKKNKLSVAGRPGYSPVLPRVPLTLGGHKFNLVYTFNALARLENEANVNAFKIVDFQNITATNLRAMLWVAMITDQPDITLEEVGDLMEIGDIREIYAALLYAYTRSQPEPKKKEDENPPEAEDEKSDPTPQTP
jgi:hypothetical protein